MATITEATQGNAESEIEKKRKKSLEAYNALQAPVNPYAGSGYLSSQVASQYAGDKSVHDYNRAILGREAGLTSGPQSERDIDITRGQMRGANLFYNDPDMQATRDRLLDLSKGYSGQELGALKAGALKDIQGQRGGYLKQLASNTARAGVGGARGAAMAAAADQGFMEKTADAERKMALDQAQLTRSGTQDLTDFLMKQKYGTLATMMGEGQLGASDRGAAESARAANKSNGGLFDTWICTEMNKDQKFSIEQSNILQELKLYGLEHDPKSTQKYLDDGQALVQKMNEKLFDYSRLRGEVEQIIEMFKSGAQEMAYTKYKQMVLNLVNEYFGSVEGWV